MTKRKKIPHINVMEKDLLKGNKDILCFEVSIYLSHIFSMEHFTIIKEHLISSPETGLIKTIVAIPADLCSNKVKLRREDVGVNIVINVPVNREISNIGLMTSDIFVKTYTGLKQYINVQ